MSETSFEGTEEVFILFGVVSNSRWLLIGLDIFYSFSRNTAFKLCRNGPLGILNGEHSPLFPSGGVTVPTVVMKTFVFR